MHDLLIEAQNILRRFLDEEPGADRYVVIRDSVRELDINRETLLACVPSVLESVIPESSWGDTIWDVLDFTIREQLMDDLESDYDDIRHDHRVEAWVYFREVIKRLNYDGKMVEPYDDVPAGVEVRVLWDKMREQFGYGPEDFEEILR